MLLDRRYYERRNFDRSKVEAAEDVLGGEGSWENVDRSMGTSDSHCLVFVLNLRSR